MASVLIIEDNPLNMKLASLLLRNAGHTVLCAADAETGLTLAHTTPPDLILMDFQLPGMSGLQAISLLKQDPASASIPIIALTAMAMEDSRDAGCDAYIAKPLRYQDLSAAIDNLLTKRGSLADRAGALPHTAPEQHSPGSASSQVPAAQAVDVEILKSLIGNEPAVILEFLQAFQIGAAPIAVALRAACNAHQPVQAGTQAHKLRSSAQTVGAQALGKLCAEMETAGKAGKLETLLTLLPVFEHELTAVNAFLDTYADAGFISPEPTPDPTASRYSPRRLPL